MDKEIIIKIWRKNAPNLDIVDTPGIVNVDREGQDGIAKATLELVTNYVKKHKAHSIFLMTIAPSGDTHEMGQTTAMKIIVRDEHIEKQCLAVLTKFDLAHNAVGRPSASRKDSLLEFCGEDEDEDDDQEMESAFDKLQNITSELNGLCDWVCTAFVAQSMKPKPGVSERNRLLRHAKVEHLWFAKNYAEELLDAKRGTCNNLIEKVQVMFLDFEKEYTSRRKLQRTTNEQRVAKGGVLHGTMTQAFDTALTSGGGEPL
jgi:hypothetical protein